MITSVSVVSTCRLFLVALKDFHSSLQSNNTRVNLAEFEEKSDKLRKS